MSYQPRTESYQQDNSLEDWRAHSAVALAKKCQDWTDIEFRLPPKTFRYAKEACDQAIEDAHQDDANARRFARMNVALAKREGGFELAIESVDARLEKWIKHYGLTPTYFARGYAHKYRMIRKQLANQK